MKKNLLLKIFGVLCIILGIMYALTNGVFIGFAIMCIGIAVFFTMEVGSDSKTRDLYDKELANAAGFDLDKLYDELCEYENSIGPVWRSRHDSIPGMCIVIGPSPFKDYVVIGQKDSKLMLKMSTVTEHLKYAVEDAWRFEYCVDTSNLTVTPKSYSSFASYKVMAVAMLDDITNYCQKIIAGENPDISDLPGKYNMYHYHSPESIVTDLDGNEYATAQTMRGPLDVKIHDMDGELLATVEEIGKGMGTSVVKMSGEEYGTIVKDKNVKTDSYYCRTPDGLFRVDSFPAVRKANLAANYRLTLDGETKAILAGNAAIRFENEGLVANDIICSYDDDFLLMYIAMQEYVMGINSFLR